MANTNGLGDVLREARNKAELSLRALAKKLDITPSYISDIENDRRVPSEDVLHQLADVLKLKFDDLMALAGRVGDRTERYLKQHPQAGVLFRRLEERGVGDDQIQRLIKEVDKMGEKKDR